MAGDSWGANWRMTEVASHRRYFYDIWIPERTSELEAELLSEEPESARDAERVAAAIFDRTGLDPTEYEKLSAGGKLVWLERALNKQHAGIPPREILAELTPMQRKLLAFLWSHPTTSTEEIQEQIWGEKVVGSSSILRFLERLQEGLLAAGCTDYMIELPGDDQVVLIRSGQ